jgi:hypothetical protein
MSLHSFHLHHHMAEPKTDDRTIVERKEFRMFFDLLQCTSVKHFQPPNLDTPTYHNLKCNTAVSIHIPPLFEKVHIEGAAISDVKKPRS